VRGDDPARAVGDVLDGDDAIRSGVDARERAAAVVVDVERAERAHARTGLGAARVDLRDDDRRADRSGCARRPDRDRRDDCENAHAFPLQHYYAFVR
jgi:hypothetical protein